MPSSVIASAQTNPVVGSVVRAVMAEFSCVVTLDQNSFGDLLPIIPSDSQTIKNHVLFRQKFRAKVFRQPNNEPVSGNQMQFQSDNEDDRITLEGKTNKFGEISFFLETRDLGVRTITTSSSNITMLPFEFEISQAWYELPFLITGYNVCEENDFSGQFVEAQGLNEKHKEDFLFGAGGVPMQGSGKTSDGRYIRLSQMGGGWHRNKNGNPDRVDKPSQTRFQYATNAKGAFGNVTEDHSVAIDKTIIPKKARIFIDGVGERTADDTGSAIKKYHIDVFLGSGKEVVKKWLKGNINGTTQKVKYLGPEK